MSNESASTLSDEYIGWILIFWLSSEVHYSPRGTLSRFDKCSPPSQQNGKWSDVLETMAVGRDPVPIRQMRVHQRCQMNILDDLWYFDHPQRAITHLRATLSRCDKCSSPFQKNGKWSDAIEVIAVGGDPAPRSQMKVRQRCQMNT